MANVAGDYREVMLDNGSRNEEIDVKVAQHSVVAAFTGMIRSSSHVIVRSSHKVRSRAKSGLRRRYRTIPRASSTSVTTLRCKSA